jgi:hypothetical protein
VPELLLPLATKPSLVGHAEAIRLAVTPVFLLAGISGLLGVLTSRMARIVDRARWLKERPAASSLAERRDNRWEQGMLRQRMRLVSRAIALTTFCYLLVALVVVLLFVSSAPMVDLSPLVAPLFVLAMLSLMAAVLLLLREVQLGSRGLALY